MQMMSVTQKRNLWLAGVLYLILLSLVAWRLTMPKPGPDARGTATWIKIAFLLLLYVYINLAALGLGRFLLKYFVLSLLTKTEFALLAYLLGLGSLSAGIMILGLVGWLNAGTIFFWLAVAGAIALIEWRGRGPLTWTDQFPRVKSLYLILLQIILALGLLLLLLECLLPVWDYDALLYHLEVPRQFLAQGQFYFDPEVLRSAYPYLGEMLFLAGIAFDLDSLAKLVNLTYAILFLLSSCAFSRRFFGTESTYTTAGILIGVPAFWMWATWAGIDFAWGTYEFWSVYLVFLWLVDGKKNSRKWLILAGVMSGLAASTKYLSIPTLLIVGVLIVWKSVQDSKQPVKDAFSNLITFGLTSAVVAGAWYIKNWIWTGNPVYPLAFGGLGWEPLENQVLNDYVYSFGVGKSWLDFLLLPYNVYAFHNRFSTIGLEIIHPVLWLAFLFPFIWKSSRKFDLIIVYTILGFVLWAVNSQVIRFLLPLTAFWSILAGAVIETFPALWKNLVRFGLIGGFMLFNLLFQMVWVGEKGSLSYLSGMISASEYLQNMNYDARAIEHVQESLNVGENALFLWDGRSYYCEARCIPDDEQSTAVRLAIESPSPETLAKDLREDGITHLLLSKPDANWFITYHDPRGVHRQSLDYFTDTFFPACGKPVYSDQAMALYEITCR
jgi:hypothetical protein